MKHKRQEMQEMKNMMEHICDNEHEREYTKLHSNAV